MSLRDRPVRLSGATGPVGAVVLCFLLALALPRPAWAQSLVRGEIEGSVTAASGSSLYEAVVSATNERSGIRHVVTTARDGSYRIEGLAPGEYTVRHEALGYRPLVYVGVTIQPDRVLDLDGALEPEPPPVEVADTVVFGQTGSGGVERMANGGRWFGRRQLDAHTEVFPGLTEVADLSSEWDGWLGSQGLPANLTQTYLDGTPFTPATHPYRAADPLALAALPRRGLGQVELVESGTDVEWTGSPGGYVSVGTRSAAGEPGGTLAGWGSPVQLWDDEAFEGEAPDGLSYWGSGSADVPLGGDSTRLFVAGEAVSLKTPRWLAVDGELLSAVEEGAGGSAAGLDRTWQDEMEVFSGLARLDWTLGSGVEVTARVNGSRAERMPAGFFNAPASYGQAPSSEATDLAALVSARVPLGNRFVLETRGAFERSERLFGDRAGAGKGSPLPSTRMVSDRVVLGAAPGGNGSVLRTAFHGGPVLHYDLGVHRFKGGVDLSLPSYEYDFRPPLEGTFFFSGPEELRAEEGAYTAVEGGRPVTFDVPRVGAFVQYQWHLFPTLTLTSGVRWDGEYLPRDEIAVNDEWRNLTGLSNRNVPASVRRWGGRFAVDWDVTEDRGTVLHGSVAGHAGRVAPETLHEILLLDGSVAVRRGVGVLGSWPGAPDPAVSGEPAPVLALADPDLRGPFTTRAVLSLSRGIGLGTTLRVSGTYRRTDYLPRRRDLNRLLLPVADSNLGRPVYGELAQVGSVLQAVPGTNRRFEGFDRVWALDSNGWSEYAGVSVALEGSWGPVDAFADYTLSRTEDNWVGAGTALPDAGIGPALVGGDAGAGGGWTEGVSDFDRPHRAVVGVDVGFNPAGFLAFSLGATYRMQSGAPFTPSYPVGSDVNADGSSYNDPAYVGDEPTLREMAGEWDCLDGWFGRVVERNACRAPADHFLDVRLGVTLAAWSSGEAQLLLEGFNLLDTRTGPRDAALLLVDPDRSVTGQGSSSVEIPTVANPSFGDLLFPTAPGRRMRVGLRIGAP